MRQQAIRTLPFSMNDSGQFHRFGALILTAAQLLMASCTEGGRQAPTEPPKVSVRAMVTPAVAARISDKGQFVELTSRARGDNSWLLAPDSAAVLAEKYIRIFGPLLRHPFEDQRGREIDFPRLRRGPRVVLADSPIDAVPADGGMPLQKAAGPYYLIDLYAPNEEGRTLTVGVSVYASDIEVTDVGLKASGPYGNEFRVWVTPVGGAGEPRMSAENAVTRVYGTLAERVRTVPMFVRTAPDVAPQIGRWRVELEHPVSLQNLTTGVRTVSDVVYVDADGTIQVESQRPRATVRLRYLSLTTGRLADSEVAARAGYALSFDAVVP